MISAVEIEDAFPQVNPGVRPLGARVLVQLRMVRQVTAGGIVLAPATREFNEAVCQFAKVVALGPLAFRNRTTGELWPEGMWASPGDVVRVPRYGGDRMAKEIPEGTIVFVIFDDAQIDAIIDPENLASLDELI